LIDDMKFQGQNLRPRT